MALLFRLSLSYMSLHLYSISALRVVLCDVNMFRFYPLWLFMLSAVRVADINAINLYSMCVWRGTQSDSIAILLSFHMQHLI